MANTPSRGEVWLADLDPVRNHEQAGERPVLIVSANLLNHGPTRLAFVVPITSRGRDNPFFVPITPPDGGVKVQSYALCTALRSVSIERLKGRAWGEVSTETIAIVEDRLRVLLEL